ncbi:TPA: type 1 fimbrial protein [Providencia alcalifaciens]|nr:type 1 fimbrial protein [Providencia alcalifaciens]HEQ1860189.1 type 1 fimbrial protein [Providencia alcalifaciens]
MMLKKIALATTLFAGISGVNFYANAAEPSAEVTLQGVITNSNCVLTVNGGKSVLNIGVFKSSEFTANTKVGSINMPVTLTDCSPDETGDLIIQGITSIANNDKNIFVNSDTDTVGFMIAKSDDTTILSANEGTPVAIATDATSSDYSFKVGMATTDMQPAAGAYSAPVLVAYIVN